MKHSIYGAGGHGKVVFEAMQTMGLNCESFFDDADIFEWMGLKVYPSSKLSLSDSISLHLAIGNGAVREKIAEQLVAANFFSVYHSAAIVSQTAEVGVGTLVAAQAIIGPDAKVGNHCIINHSAVVDHDCTVGDYSHIAPLSTIGGASKVGKGVLIGSGAVVLPGIEISDYVTVGAGAVVTKNISAGEVVIGNPARKMN